jgi:hypothetical protein
MKSLAVLLAFFFLCSRPAATPHSSFLDCLPDGIKLTDVVSAQIITSDASGSVTKKIVVEQKLAELKARCKKGLLVDSKGREIYFYRLTGCWGNPPEGYEEILERQRNEIEELKKRYTVIEMTCNPDGAQIN